MPKFNIHLFSKQEEKLKSAKGKNRHIGAERKARFPEAEESLKTWVLEFRMDGIAVTLNMFLLNEIVKLEKYSVDETGLKNYSTTKLLEDLVKMNVKDKIKVSTSFLNFCYDETKLIWNERCELQIRKEKRLMINKKMKFKVGGAGYRYSVNNRSISLRVKASIYFNKKPLDFIIHVIQPFKDKLREKWNIWMSLGQFTYNKGGNLRKPGYDCGISNAMDGSEDDLFGQDENGEEIDENEREIVGKL
ncbi:hypothetical protein RhiirA5_421012 [Rhizophagus irregularis]|uniref:HTH CENPB-type domain-containing protein n=1 Tax=Rhizophagus irregularis TaxID=588596 RepID=A0A2I1FDU1_9GLOM|nr:hypothetical protein RhiirA5_421012 [Rhizophagus irregularis]PKC60585.1 hypothetical protein RhiirA1_467824 [Rhizophagus irregularis]PKY32543.1 hypothetical protein RhiirB3_450806 [Rhizophagus irregularis]